MWYVSSISSSSHDPYTPIRPKTGGPRETPKAHTMLMKQVGNKRPTFREPCRRHGRSQIFHVGSFSGHQSLGKRAQAIRKSTQKKPMYRLKKQQLSQSNTCKVD
jgi:hypothetical protein